MSFSEITNEARGYVSALSIICFIISLAVAAYILQSSTNKKRFFASLAVTLPMFVIVVFLMEYNKIINTTIEGIPSEFSKTLDKLPISFYIIFSIFALLFSIYNLLKTIDINRQNLNRMSIKDSMDNLPDAIMFVSKDGDIYLRNRMMNRLSLLFTGIPLKNGHDFWETITSSTAAKFTVIDGDAPALKSGDEVWQFSKSELEDERGRYTAIKATDISDLYSLSLQTEFANNKLYDQQSRIKKLISMIEDNAQTVAVTNLLTSFHDNFGSMLALTKRQLSEEADSLDVLAMLEQWEELAETMALYSQKDGIEMHTLTSDNILEFAQKLDCTLHINGEINYDDEELTLINHSIYEMVKNAVYHADAKEIFVDISDDETKLVLSIKNLCNPLSQKNSEGGGLRTIRNMAEELGGYIEIECGQYFILTVVLPKIQVI